MQQHLQTWLAGRREADPDGDPIAPHVERELRDYLECGILACGFARAYCDTATAARPARSRPAGT